MSSKKQESTFPPKYSGIAITPQPPRFERKIVKKGKF
jgi:hypothetical protein